MTNTTTHNFPDIYFTVVATKREYEVEFKVYELFGTLSNGTPVYGSKFLENIEDAEVYLSGNVKWDGCSNWLFDEQERGTMLHGCSRQDLTDLGEVMARCWDIAAGMLETLTHKKARPKPG